jgi:MFS family permease
MRAGPDRTRTTYFYELWRAATAGILETAGSTFLLAIAVKYFAAGALAKGIVAGSGSLGLLLSPVVVSVVTSAGWPVSRAAARILAVGAGCFFIAAAAPGLPVFIGCSVLAMASSAAVIPLLTQMYQDNYPEKERGRRFSRTVMIRIAMAAAFSKMAGDALDGRIEHYRWLLLVFGGALALAGFCLARCPTQPIPPDGGAHPLRALRFVREDALFRRTLICWMLMGFANLMMLPLRVEYLANPKYHLAVGIGAIALLTGVIPNVARLVLSPVWGYLFDHMNFFALRVTLNLGFAIGILAFFTTSSWTGLILGAVVYGISNAGGDVAWSLWVTKFAPPGRVADYMSVHTFLTGVRGVLAPVVAFAVAGHAGVGSQYSLGVLAGMSSGLILLATALLLPEIKLGKKTRPAAALVEEVSE